jgi:hypothetical protein
VKYGKSEHQPVNKSTLSLKLLAMADRDKDDERGKVSALSSSTVSGPKSSSHAANKVQIFPLFRLQKRISFVLAKSEVKPNTLVKQKVDEPQIPIAKPVGPRISMSHTG